MPSIYCIHFYLLSGYSIIFSLLLSKLKPNTVLLQKGLNAGKHPHAQYVFSHWHRISPSKDIEKKISKCQYKPVMVRLSYFEVYR